MAAESEVRFRVLGPLEASIAGRTLSLGGSKPRTLLAALLVDANRVVSADLLVDVLWGDLPPERATSTVQKYVHELRAVLDPERAQTGDRILLTSPPGYILEVDPVQLDAARFEQLVAEAQRRAAELDLDGAEAAFDEALGLWRGPAWAEFADQDFARVDAARLESLRALAIDARADVGLAAGRHDQLVADLEATVATYPLRERPRAQLMLALYRCGRQTDALRVYQDFRRYLADEVGLEPSADLSELDAAIATRASTLDWVPPVPPALGSLLPSGTVTFLFTDIEGSTRLWEAAPEAMRKAVARHDDVVRWVVEAHGGYVFATGGDGFAAAFRRAGDALEASLRIQQQLIAESWPDAAPIRVRIGLHSGEVEERGGDYFGPAVNRAARVMAVAHGGQVLLSATTASIVRDLLPSEASLLDLGTHRLRDLSEPEALFQAAHPDLPPTFPPLRTMELSAGNLPTQRSSFIGRAAELDRLGALLAERRLVTLSGVGGVGKTRLAVQGAAELSSSFPAGVWLVELARTRDAEAVMSIARAALGVNPAPGRSELESLCDHLGQGQVLLVVDNCEHVVDAAAELVATVLERCPSVRVLCTSREPLDLTGEQVMPVGPLEPDGHALTLFGERVREADPELDVVGAERAVGLEICRRLDGVPLAIELAAARAATMTLGEIAAGLDDRFRLLAGRRRRSDERHQALRATVDWSHDLLTETAQRLLRRLGVFAGGFQVDAAQAVAVLPGEELDAAEVLGTLVRCSMVQRDRAPGASRYRLLETIRSYAQERLEGAGEMSTVGRAHAEWMAGLVDHPFEVWATAGSGLPQRFRAERDNWRQAVGFAVAAQLPHLAVRLLSNPGSAQLEESGPMAAAALALDGIQDVPRAHWLHWILAGRGAVEMDPGLLDHVELFEVGCASAPELAHAAVYRGVRAAATGIGLPYAPIEEALAGSDLSPQLSAYLEMYRAIWRNWPDTDVEAALHALRANEAANTIWVPIAQAVVAMALRKTRPDEALAMVQEVVIADLSALGPYERSSLSTCTAIALSEIPIGAAAAHLCNQLTSLQDALTSVEMVYLAVCAHVLGRADHPAAGIVRSFLVDNGFTGTYASLLPNLPDVRPPADMPELLEVVRSALCDLLPR